MSSNRNTGDRGHMVDTRRPDFGLDYGSYESKQSVFQNRNDNDSTVSFPIYSAIPPQDARIPMLGGMVDTQGNGHVYEFQGARGRRKSRFPNSVPLSQVRPGNVTPTETQLDLAYAYGIRRDDGMITRLVRADCLNTQYMNPNMPQWQSEEGLIILPQPRQKSPDSRRGLDPVVPEHLIRELKYPVTSASLNRYSQELDQMQVQIDAIVNTSKAHSSSAIKTPPRRQKVYCDKWIHEGVCAFTQMGCKYKHEMPSDKATQISLGLNHGYPAWYRRAYGVPMSPYPPPPPPVPVQVSTAQRAIEGNWRRHSDARSENAGLVPVGAAPGVPASFGPIGPPPSSYNAYGTSPPYSLIRENANRAEGLVENRSIPYNHRSGYQESSQSSLL